MMEAVEKSPSSRRAWIEMLSNRLSTRIIVVALLAEGVDRNLVSGYQAAALENVALLAEGVDRNSGASSLLSTVFRRPPRGGRG